MPRRRPKKRTTPAPRAQQPPPSQEPPPPAAATTSSSTTDDSAGAPGVAASSTDARQGHQASTSAPDPAELARIASEIRATGDRAVASSSGDGAAAAAEAEHEVLDRLDKLADGDPATLAALEALSADDIADLCELAFGLVADIRGKHWELSPRSAQRLAKWFKRSLDRHGWQWMAKWLPDVVALLLLAFEIWKRWEQDKKLKGEKGPDDGTAAP